MLLLKAFNLIFIVSVILSCLIVFVLHLLLCLRSFMYVASHLLMLIIDIINNCYKEFLKDYSGRTDGYTHAMEFVTACVYLVRIL
jgi:hypothetical protein